MQPGAGTATATTATLLNGFLSDLGDKQTHAELERLANDLQTIKAEYVSLEAYFDLFSRELRKHLLFCLTESSREKVDAARNNLLRKLSRPDDADIASITDAFLLQATLPDLKALLVLTPLPKQPEDNKASVSWGLHTVASIARATNTDPEFAKAALQRLKQQGLTRELREVTETDQPTSIEFGWLNNGLAYALTATGQYVQARLQPAARNTR